MEYLSTRGQAPVLKFSDILLEGLAADGGLYVPAQYPHIASAELARLSRLPYGELAWELLRRYIDDIAEDELARLVVRTYTATRYPFARHPARAARITPLTWLEEGRFGLLELSNGPTLAFKDMALQLLGELFEHVLERRDERLNILGATSGDTGSAAEYAMRGRERVQVFMLSPAGRMSPFQRAQMYSLQEPNIHNLAVEGTFDDAQDIVKAVSQDADFKRRHRIGAVNSINWARIAAQVVYYFAGYFQAVDRVGEPVAFAVPSGNFGNILAGHIARQMGLPIGRLILATNENDVLDEFFRTGVYRPRASSETFATSSPSMDISKASNFERFVFDLVGRDPEALRRLWQALETQGHFDLEGTPYWARLPEFGFVSGRSTHADRIATIRDVWTRHRVLIDPHTADAVTVARRAGIEDMPVVVLETAQAAKFAETLREAVGFEPPRPAELADLEQRPQRVTRLPADVQQVKDYIAAHA